MSSFERPKKKLEIEFFFSYKYFHTCFEDDIFEIYLPSSKKINETWNGVAIKKDTSIKNVFYFNFLTSLGHYYSILRALKHFVPLVCFEVSHLSRKTNK